ncbi:MAG: SEC-C metal-binding domain-containing protein [Pseudomonadota bacterium]
MVHGDKELLEKLGRKDPCPCGSGRRFQGMLPTDQSIRWLEQRRLLSGRKPKSELGLALRLLD